MARALLHPEILAAPMMRSLVECHGVALAKYVVIGGPSALAEWAGFWLLLKVASLDYITAAIVVLAGIGALIAAGHRPGDISFGAYAILGLVPLMAVGLVANFLTPLTHDLALATVAFGLVSFAVRRRQIWLSLGARPMLMLGLLCALLVAFAAGAAITPPAHDTGLYHLQAIEWLDQSTRAFGLANLHLRIGT